MGNVVVHALIGPREEVKTLRGKAMCIDGRPSAVTYHPLAARHRPQLYPRLAADFRFAPTRPFPLSIPLHLEQAPGNRLCPGRQ